MEAAYGLKIELNKYELNTKLMAFPMLEPHRLTSIISEELILVALTGWMLKAHYHLCDTRKKKMFSRVYSLRC